MNIVEVIWDKYIIIYPIFLFDFYCLLRICYIFSVFYFIDMILILLNTKLIEN